MRSGVATRQFLYAGSAGERATRAITKNAARSAPIKAHTARRTAHSYTSNVAPSRSSKLRCLMSHVCPSHVLSPHVAPSRSPQMTASRFLPIRRFQNFSAFYDGNGARVGGAYGIISLYMLFRKNDFKTIFSEADCGKNRLEFGFLAGRKMR